ncbi:hypothetical protein C8J56DRAFT_806547 [Mycena floridula]|nr:hypothetical protein C8J56DRAFT_806547 [Mycena floridula]
MSIAEKDVPRLQILVQTSLRNGDGPKAIVNRIVEAAEGLRSTKGYNESDLDLATLVYRLGGRSLLYALNHSLGLPSLRTLCNSADFVKIAPTIGQIDKTEISANIQNVVIKPRVAAGINKRRGIAVLIDEIAIEEAAVYFSKQNQVGGLCSKHSGTISLELRNIHSVETIVDALREDKVHFGKEMTVMAIKFVGEKGANPILLAPTCKQEDMNDAANLFQLAIRCWEELGREIGDIWYFATDGDAIRRAAGYQEFVCYELPTTDPLYVMLGNMPGLNLFTGEGNRLVTFDWRHLEKRTGTLVRSFQGMVIDNGIKISPVILARYMVLLPDEDEASVFKLLNPDDPQDVPRALDLLEAIIGLRHIELVDSTPNSRGELESLQLFGYLLEGLVRPFTNPNLTLTEQVTGLSVYAHMSFVFFRRYRIDFMSNQLYGDYVHYRKAAETG